jgi:hypothetical protein
MLNVAKSFGFTQSDDLDMDTTVQGAGITHPTEMKLMHHLMKRLTALHGAIKSVGGRGLRGVKSIVEEFKKHLAKYRFFAKDKKTKTELLRKAMELSSRGLQSLSVFLPEQKTFEKLQPRYQKEILRLQSLGPELMDQIRYWLHTGKVAKDKIVSF